MFCFDCLKIWKSKYKNYCGNNQCLNPIFLIFNKGPSDVDTLKQKRSYLSLNQKNVKFHDIVRKKLTVVVYLPNNQKIELELEPTTNVSRLKKMIYDSYYEDLKPEQTVVQTLQNFIPTSNQALNKVAHNGKCYLIQRRAEIWEIPHLKTDKEAEDPVSCQQGVAFMRCGHSYSRGSMKYLVETQVNRQGKSEVQCARLK